MKKLLSLLVLIAIAPFVLKAEKLETVETQTQKALNADVIKLGDTSPILETQQNVVESDIFNYNKNYPDTLEVFMMRSATSDIRGPKSQIITYEPISQTVSLLHPMYANPGVLELFYTQDNGATWSKRDLIEENTITFPYWATMGVFNRTNTTDASELEYIALYQTTTYNTTTQEYNNDPGIVVHMATPSGDEIFTVTEPADNNDKGGYSFTMGQVATLQTEDDGQLLMTNVASPANDIEFQVGPAYFASFSLDYEDIDKSLMLPHYGPDEVTYWGDDLGSFVLSSNFMDTDPEGNVYIANVNYLQPNHPTQGQTLAERVRTPAFMKSSDGGETWSELVKYPAQKLIDYVEANGQDKEENYVLMGGQMPYKVFGFAVTGEDKLTMVIPIQVILPNDEGAKYLLTDITYNNGTWEDPKVIHEIEGSYSIEYMVQSDEDQVETDSIAPGWGDNLELQLAKVANSEDLVLKFVKPTHYVALDTTYRVKAFVDNQVQYLEIDSIQNTGVFGVTRKDGQWKDVLTIVDDELRNETNSFIPHVVPSADAVPMLYSLGSASVDTYWRYGYKGRMFDLCADWWHRYYFSTYDFSKPTSVEENPVVKSDVNMNVYPNPASEDAYIEYTTANENVRLEIFDVLGNKVMTVLTDQMQSVGTRIAPINVSELSNGTYYIHLTVGNETFTKTLNVVR